MMMQKEFFMCVILTVNVNNYDKKIFLLIFMHHHSLLF